MISSIEGDDQYARTYEAIQRAGISVSELWVYYFSMGGDFDEWEVNAYLHGLVPLPALHRDMLSQSVNEMYDDMCRSPRAPYSSKITMGD